MRCYLKISSLSVLITLSITLALIFIFFPNIDIYVSSLFFDKQKGFFLNRNNTLVAIHQTVPYIASAFATTYITLLLLSFFKTLPLKSLCRTRIIFLILTLSLGPGVLVNSIFKDNWGRARPLQTEIFGQDKKFTPAFVITNQCNRNCSFTSGDASVGFAIFAFAFIYRRKKYYINMLAITAGSLLGTARIMQGSHFLSDVIFSGIFVYFTCWSLYKLMFSSINYHQLLLKKERIR